MKKIGGRYIKCQLCGKTYRDTTPYYANRGCMVCYNEQLKILYRGKK